MHWASGIPHALFGRKIYQRLGRMARRGRERVFAVIATRWLAMTLYNEQSSALKIESGIFVGWAKRSVPTSSRCAVGTAQARLCPPYETAFEIRVTSLRGVKRRSNPDSVIPGRCEASNPESRDSGSAPDGASRNDACGFTRGACHDTHPRRTRPPYGATSSTRRLSARPASEALEPIGASRPTPAVRSRGWAMR